jgi:5-formyltetrahydrofolate cyclo-ligase
MPATRREQARAAIREQVLLRCRRDGLASGALIAAYEPLPTEPGSTELLAELDSAGYQVMVPLTLPDRDLDWLRWRPGGADAHRLGLAAVGSADLILVPAFAVDPAGHRLGRGGGSYDRALARVGRPVTVAALLFAGEIVTEVPTDPWDRPVTAAVTPDGWTDFAPPAFTPTGRGNTG